MKHVSIEIVFINIRDWVAWLSHTAQMQAADTQKCSIDQFNGVLSQ